MQADAASEAFRNLIFPTDTELPQENGALEQAQSSGRGSPILLQQSELITNVYLGPDLFSMQDQAREVVVRLDGNAGSKPDLIALKPCYPSR